MRSHAKPGEPKIDIISLVDVKQMAMYNHKVINETNVLFNGQKTYKVSEITGYYTLPELIVMFTH